MTQAMTRRALVKAGALGATLAAAGSSSLLSIDGFLEEAHADEEESETIAYCTHQVHCHGDCCLQCTVRDGRLVMLEPNEALQGTRYGTMCLKGASEIQHVYSADRIQTPMKRVGERGSGEFVSISWDEAIEIIGRELSACREKYGKDSIFVEWATDSRMDYLANVLQCSGSPGDGYDIGVANGLDPAMGYGGFGNAPNESRDWANARTMLMVGTNFLESALIFGRTFFEAKEAGCHITVIDPNYSTSAAKANEWVPIKPATDAALFLGMITEIIEEDYLDRDFMQSYTAFPFLANTADGTLLREHEPVFNTVINAEKGADNPFYVYDLDSQSIVPYTESANPALEGTFERDGIVYTTVFELLKANQANYPVSWAAEKSDIPEETIRDLAYQYACNKPSIIALGWNGNDKFANADISGHAAAVLAALTGNSGYPGAGVGVYTCGGSYRRNLSLASWPLPEDDVYIRTKRAYYMITRESNIHAYISVGETLQQAFADLNQTLEWVKKLDFVLYCDIYASTTADWADVILPCCTKFENDEPYGRLRNGYNHVSVESKVLDPLFDSRTDFRVMQAICSSLGLEDHLPASQQELTEYQISQLAQKPGWEGLTLEKMVENKCVMPMPGIEKPRQNLLDHVYNTRSTRVDVYYDDLLIDNQQLPNWEEPNEVYDDNPLREKYPLQMYALHTKFHIHCQFYDATWIQQFHEPAFEMNPLDMAERGLETGDMVRVFNDRGEFKAPCAANPSLRPGCTNIYEGAWSKHMAEGNVQMVTNATMLERGERFFNGPVIPFHDTLVQVEKTEA